MIPSTLTRKERRDIKILALFTSVYCRDRRHAQMQPLVDLPAGSGFLEDYSCCADCRRFMTYAIDRRLHCPLPHKPACKHCPVHCYSSEYRRQARDIMRYSGKALIRRGRLDLLCRYLF